MESESYQIITIRQLTDNDTVPIIQSEEYENTYMYRKNIIN